MPGVIRTRVGYAGGKSPNPTYHNIDGHTETLEIDYDPDIISYEDLLGLFWASHNPFARSYSRQYASIIFYHNAEQKELAQKSKDQLEAKRGRKAATEILSLKSFHLAEDYHQKYSLRGSGLFMSEMHSWYKNERALVDSTLAARLNGYLGGNGDYRLLQKELGLMGLSDNASHSLEEMVKARGTGNSGASFCPVL